MVKVVLTLVWRTRELWS